MLTRASLPASCGSLIEPVTRIYNTCHNMFFYYYSEINNIINCRSMDDNLGERVESMGVTSGRV